MGLPPVRSRQGQLRGDLNSLSAPDPSFHTLRPGRVDFRRALALQRRLAQLRPGREGDFLILLEHDPVITLGRGFDPSHLLLEPQQYALRGLALEQACRGGDITYHGPGQLVGYPIVNLCRQGRDLHLFLRRLEEVLIRTLASLGIGGARKDGLTGVWVGEEKIASLGIGVRNWISRHGFSLNVGADLEGFDTIVPCGISGVRMTSIESILGRRVSLGDVEQPLIDAFARVFALKHAGDYEDSTQT